MKPVLKPALRRLWRDNSTLQLGVDPRHAVVLTGLDSDAIKVLEMLDGSRERNALLRAARARGVAEETARRLLDLLTRAGALDDAATYSRRPAALPPDDLERLRPDLASLCLDGADAETGIHILARRRAARVRVHGAGRVGASVASLLAAAGVGHVHVRDPGSVRPGDVSPAGYASADVGAPREDAADRVVRRSAPATTTSPAGNTVSLVVLAPVGAADPAVAATLVRENVPHLFVGVRETVGVVGPLAIPGITSCLRCQELHRRDRDPARARVLAQLCRPLRVVEACDTVLATAVAAQGAFQALTHLDGLGRPPAANGALELSVTDWGWRRRSWPPHPGCGCG